MICCTQHCAAEAQVDLKRTKRHLHRYRKRAADPIKRLLLRELRKWPIQGVLTRNQEIEPSGNDSTQVVKFAVPFADSFGLTGVLENAEREPITRTLASTHGAQAEAARRGGSPAAPSLTS